jgi:hypothetical protein
MISKPVRKSLQFVLPAFAAATLFFFVSCQKEDTADFVNKAGIIALQFDVDLEAIRLAALMHKAAFDTTLFNRDTAMIDSVLVTHAIDTISNKRYFLFDFGENQVGPDWNKRSGKIEAVLKGNFNEDGSTFLADIDMYSFEDFQIGGELLLSNLGISGAGSILYSAAAELESYDTKGNHISQTSARDFLWTEGLSEPENPETHEFFVSGNTAATIAKSGETPIPHATLESTITTDWIMRFSCGKLINSGSFSVAFEAENTTEIITGEFTDSDLDGCSDKVMFKNNQNFGYPFYF